MAVTPVDVAGSIGKGLQVRQLRQQMEAQKEAQQSRNALKSLYAERFGGHDPQSGITWQTGRMGPAAPAGSPMPAPQGAPQGAPGGVTTLAAMRGNGQPAMPGGAPAQPGPMMGDREFTNRVAQITGDPQQAINWQQYFDSQNPSDLAQNTAEAPLVVAAFENVQDQAGHDRARLFLHNRGVDVSDISPEYNRETTNMVLQGARYLAGQWPKEGPKAPEGFRSTPAGGLEPIPGYLEGKRSLADATRAPQGAQTDAAKLEQDFRNGYLTAEQYESAKLQAGQPDPKDTFKNSDKLRDEFVAQSKDFVAARDAYARVQSSAKDPSAAGDLALIFNYMKVLDPGSVVRESEFATAANSGAFGARIAAQVNRVLSGQRLSDSMRKDFVDRAGRLYRDQEKLHNQLRNQYTSLSERFELSPENVVTEMRGQFPGAAGTGFPPPAPGPAAAAPRGVGGAGGQNPPATAISGPGVAPPPPDGNVAGNRRMFEQSEQSKAARANGAQGQQPGAASYEGWEAENPATGEVLIFLNGQWVPKR